VGLEGLPYPTIQRMSEKVGVIPKTVGAKHTLRETSYGQQFLVFPATCLPNASPLRQVNRYFSDILSYQFPMFLVYAKTQIHPK
jgi:hypothetical protein